MERAGGELKAALAAQLGAGRPLPVAELQRWAELVVHALNHRPRRCLQGAEACGVFQGARAALRAYPRRRRRVFFDEVNHLAGMLMQSPLAFTPRHAGTARRLAVEVWLQRHRLITVTRHPAVSPSFLSPLAHY